MKQRKPAQSNKDLVQPGEKKGGRSNKSKNNKQETITNMVNINPLISTITLSVNCLNIPIKNKNCQIGKNSKHNYLLSIRNPL